MQKKLNKYFNDQVAAGNFSTVEDAQQYVATQLGLRSHSSVRHWSSGVYQVNPKHVRELSRITGIPREELRPDIFGE